MMTRAYDVLAYIDFVFGLMWREKYRQDPTIEWQPDQSYMEMGCTLPVQRPGEIEPRDVHNGLFLAYAGLLDIQLYWPASPPVCD
jgi:hypothetical protein